MVQRTDRLRRWQTITRKLPYTYPGLVLAQQYVSPGTHKARLSSITPPRSIRETAGATCGVKGGLGRVVASVLGVVQALREQVVRAQRTRRARRVPLLATLRI
jgi:hypothetical protein